MASDRALIRGVSAKSDGKINIIHATTQKKKKKKVLVKLIPW